MVRVAEYWGLYWGSLIYGNYHILIRYQKPYLKNARHGHMPPHDRGPEESLTLVKDVHPLYN